MCARTLYFKLTCASRAARALAGRIVGGWKCACMGFLAGARACKHTEHAKRDEVISSSRWDSFRSFLLSFFSFFLDAPVHAYILINCFIFRCAQQERAVHDSTRLHSYFTRIQFAQSLRALRMHSVQTQAHTSCTTKKPPEETSFISITM